jgi:hypothetical protein
LDVYRADIATTLPVALIKMQRESMRILPATLKALRNNANRVQQYVCINEDQTNQEN